MLVKKSSNIKASEITDQKVYLNRRLFMRGALLAGSVTATRLLYRKLNPPPAVVEERPKIAGLVKPPTDQAVQGGFKGKEPPTSFRGITNYNNFRELATQQRRLAAVARS